MPGFRTCLKTGFGSITTNWFSQWQNRVDIGQEMVGEIEAWQPRLKKDNL